MNLWGEETCQKGQCTSAIFCGPCYCCCLQLLGEAHQKLWYGYHYESHITLFGANSLDFAMLFPSLLWVASKQINQKFIAEWSFQMLTLPSKIFQGCHISILKRGHHNCTCVDHMLHWTSYNLFPFYNHAHKFGFHRRPNGKTSSVTVRPFVVVH